MRRLLYFFLFVIGFSFLQSAWAKGSESFNYLQTELNHKNYRIKIYTQEEELPFNQLHSWRIILEDEHGNTLPSLSLRIDGGMDGHSHGLPTSPTVSNSNDAYLIQGLKFQMPGEWFLNLYLSDKNKKESHIQYRFPVSP